MDELDPRIVFDYAPKKTQTGVTFLRLIENLEKRHRERNVERGLDGDTPMVVIVDNAPSHCVADVENIPRATRQSLWLSKVNGLSHVYLIMTRKNRSHELNSGDQLINLSFRSHLRQTAKLRVMNHFLAVRRGKIPPATPLDVGEATMKALLVEWCTSWMNLNLTPLIEKSWAIAMRHKVLASGENHPHQGPPLPSPLRPPNVCMHPFLCCSIFFTISVALPLILGQTVGEGTKQIKG